LQPIVAALPRPYNAPTPATTIRIRDGTRSALPVVVRVDAPAAHAAPDPSRTTVPAYSLDVA
jgi:hypothetical protein